MRTSTFNRKEFDLLLALATRAGEVVSKRQLLAEVWQLPWGGADQTIDVHLSWLRRKLGESAASPRYLHTRARRRGQARRPRSGHRVVTLRTRVVLVAVASAVAVLVLLLVPVTLLVRSNAAEAAEQDADRRRARRG